MTMLAINRMEKVNSLNYESQKDCNVNGNAPIYLNPLHVFPYAECLRIGYNIN